MSAAQVKDTAAGDIVEIALPAVGPYGVVFVADSEGCVFDAFRFISTLTNVFIAAVPLLYNLSSVSLMEALGLFNGMG
eukprot:gene41458-51239_t